MAKRPSQHIIGSQAVTAVTAVFESCGFAVEQIQNDYGEDLLVQTVLRGEIDPSRLFIQVKGTRRLAAYRRNGVLGLTLPTVQLRKWVQSPELVVLVLWDVEQGDGRWTLPLDGFDDWDLEAISKPTYRVKFDEDAKFDPRAAEVLAWRSRTANLQRQLGRVKAGIESFRVASEEGEDERIVKLFRKRQYIGFDLVSLLQILNRKAELDPAIEREIRVGVVNLRGRAEEHSISDPLGASCTLAVLGRFNKVAGQGLPLDVMNAAADTLRAAVGPGGPLELGEDKFDREQLLAEGVPTADHSEIWDRS